MQPRCCARRAEQEVLQVSQIKEKVEEKEGIPPVQQRLIYGGKQMYVLKPDIEDSPVVFRCC